MGSVPPYERREVLPISYFPFLSAEHDVSPAEAVAFGKGLATESSVPGEYLVYIHVPFCETICGFCGFYRKPLAEFSANLATVFDRFTDNLVREVEMWGECNRLQKMRVGAVYVGGGTPSTLPVANIDRILRAIRTHLPVTPDVEFTFEGEVRSLKDRAKLALLKEHSVTRVSFGVQSFDPRIRKLCHLHPNLSTIYECAQAVHDAGYAINIDLMYGLPGQKIGNLESDLETAVEQLCCSHVDLYDTILYPNTEFFIRRHNYGGLLPSDPERVGMIRFAADYLRSRNFTQITSDDFVLPGAGYTMKFLNFGGPDGTSPVLAIGPSAIGFMNEASYRNLGLEAYIGQPIEALPIGRICLASVDELRRRPFIFLSKVLRRHIPSLRYGIDDDIERVLLGQEARGLLRRVDSRWEVTDEGLEWIDAMAFEHLRPRERRRIFKIVQ